MCWLLQGELVPFRDARIKVAKGVLSSKGVGKLIGWGSVLVSGRNMWLMNQMGLIGGDFGKKCFYQSILARFINKYQYTMKLKRYIHDPLLSQVNNRLDLQLLAPLLEALPDSLSPGLRDILKLTEGKLSSCLNEADCRRYFQQLIDPENLLLDSQGNIKISDFGLSAFPEQNASNSSSLECFNGDSESNEEGQSLSNSRMNEEDDDATKELQPADPNEPGV
ncbi:CBL-interacting protein [Vigna angularis]|uniref:CBL-interacting protein n=1 Tax=Phaseolus angularis TaxID=3914 RepID=A0A8T0KW35_PHAAN|nr:CBL-interacting protein [Vigna angularis]